MITKRFHVPIFDWDVTVIEVKKKNEYPMLLKHLNAFKLSEIDKADIKRIIETDVFNGGEHFYNTGLRKSLLVIYRHLNKGELISTLCHEKRHLEDRIMEHLRIDDIETAGLLAGFLGRKIFNKM